MKTKRNLAEKLIQSHLLAGEMIPGAEIGLKIQQTLTPDPGGTFIMMQLEAINLDRVKTELSVIYVDHSLVQEDFRNPDDHLFLQSAARRFGFWFSRPGNGISHPLHIHHFAKPGKSLLGSDSHTCSSGALGMLAIGAGGSDVMMAIAGYPFYTKMPKIIGVKLTGKLPEWVSAKDLILTLLQRRTISGGVGCIFEYFGSGLDTLSVMDRVVVANMGAEMGATSSVFPSDHQTLSFLKELGREQDWLDLKADEGATYDDYEEINLSEVEPMIALPSSPDNVVAVREVEGRLIYQAYIGSSANPGYRDFAISAAMVKDKNVHPQVSYDVNPATRELLTELIQSGWLSSMVHAGARVHQAGCNGCIGMGQAPASGRNSLRTVPRNFPGRSGTPEDSVYLCSPETATASALTGKITDPRKLNMAYPTISRPSEIILNKAIMQTPLAIEKAQHVKLVKGPNIGAIPNFKPLPENFNLPVLLKVGDDVSTDTIIAGGTNIMSYRSNIPKSSEYVFHQLDLTYATRAQQIPQGHIIIGGLNYGQGSSREHAALCPRYLGLRIVIAKSFGRIHIQNLVNFGVLPLLFANPVDYDAINQGDYLEILKLHHLPAANSVLTIKNVTKNQTYSVIHTLSQHQLSILFAGGLLNWIRNQNKL